MREAGGRERSADRDTVREPARGDRLARAAPRRQGSGGGFEGFRSRLNLLPLGPDLFGYRRDVLTMALVNLLELRLLCIAQVKLVKAHHGKIAVPATIVAVTPALGVVARLRHHNRNCQGADHGARDSNFLNST